MGGISLIFTNYTHILSTYIHNIQHFTVDSIFLIK